MSYTYNVLGSDNFTPNANPVNPAKWESPPDSINPGFYGPLQASSGKCILDTSSKPNCAAKFIGVSLPPNQWVSFKVEALVPGAIITYLRVGNLSEDEYVQFNIQGPLGANCEVIVGSGTQDLADATTAINVGDTVRVSVVGSHAYFDVNGVNVPALSGELVGAPTSGFSFTGLFGDSNTAAEISTYQTGSVTGGDLAYSVPDDRTYGNFPNNSRDVQGTLTYDVPATFSLKYWFDTLFARTKSLPVDSRTSPPVDSRVDSPKNCRVAPF